MKRNIKDDFEKVYLRFQTAERDLSNLKDINKAELNSKDFIRICKYTASRSFRSNQYVFLSAGYNYEDILSLSKFYGACFLGYKDKSEAIDSKRYNYMMLYYIFQRLNRFLEWSIKKFKINEVSSFSDIEDPYILNDAAIYKNQSITIDGVRMWGIQESINLKDQVEILRDKLKITKNLKLKTGIKSNIKDLRGQILKENKERKDLTVKLKSKLLDNPSEYEDTLIYYACSKHTSVDIRKAARKYCDKLGIDYKEKLKDSFSNSADLHI